EIQEMSIQFYIIINNIDKHNENELSFSEFERSVKETFSQWNVVPEEILYSSVLNKDAPHNNLEQIKTTVFDILEKKPQTDHRIDVATNRVIDEHYKYLEQLIDEKLYDSLSDSISSHDLDLFIEMDKSINEMNEKFKRLNKRYLDMINLTLKNAYLMPSSLRDKAHSYLESLESTFKVGLFGAKKKTEEERKKRQTVFLSDLQQNIEKTIQWSLKERLNTFLNENEIQDENLVQSIEKLEVHFTENDLKEFLKPGAQVNGQYVLNYTNEISSHIKQLFRNKANVFWNEIENKLNEQTKSIKDETLANNKDKQSFTNNKEQKKKNKISQQIKHIYRKKTNVFRNKIKNKLNEQTKSIKDETLANNNVKQSFTIYQEQKNNLSKELTKEIKEFNHIIANQVTNNT